MLQTSGQLKSLNMTEQLNCVMQQGESFSPFGASVSLLKAKVGRIIHYVPFGVNNLDASLWGMLAT